MMCNNLILSLVKNLFKDRENKYIYCTITIIKYDDSGGSVQRNDNNGVNMPYN